MKRQVAITGPTPEFVRWSVRQDCALRRDTETDSVDQTEKRLRAIRAAGLAMGQQRVFDGVAVRSFDGQLKGFRIDEVAAIWGGIDRVGQHCQGCKANVLNDPGIHGLFAGCHGWLNREPDGCDWGKAIDQVLNSAEREQLPNLFLATTPVWYGLWTDRRLRSGQIEFLLQLLPRVAKRVLDASSILDEFCQVLAVCHDQSLVLDVELIPNGFSDGLHWTLATHCDRCKAAFEPEQVNCNGCRKTGRGHPLIRKKVLGLRPYVDLAVLLGPGNVEAFRERHGLSRE